MAPTLFFQVNGNGRIFVNGTDQTGNYVGFDPGLITIEAIPNPGSVFDRWDNQFNNPKLNPHPFYVTGDVTITAYFIPRTVDDKKGSDNLVILIVLALLALMIFLKSKG